MHSANDAARRLDMVGCMSFTLEELTTTVANGWYYLLEKAVGGQSHIVVPPARIPVSAAGRVSVIVRVSVNVPVGDTAVNEYLCSPRFHKQSITHALQSRSPH
jgi:hypothetical protein